MFSSRRPTQRDSFVASCRRCELGITVYLSRAGSGRDWRGVYLQLIPTDSDADLQFDFFLPASRSDDLWMTDDVRAFSVDAGDAVALGGVYIDETEDSLPTPTADLAPTPPQRHLDEIVDLEDSTFEVDSNETPRPHQTTDQSGSELASRDEHLPPRDDYDLGLRVVQPTDLRLADYRDDIANGTQYQLEGGQPSAWSETDVTSNRRVWTSTSRLTTTGPRESPSGSLSPSTSGRTEPTTSPGSERRPRQIDPPLTMHFADFVRQVAWRSSATSTKPPPTTTTTSSSSSFPFINQANVIDMTTAIPTSLQRGTSGRPQLGISRPPSRRTSSSRSSSRCGRKKCPRFRPGVRRQYCQAQFGEPR